MTEWQPSYERGAIDAGKPRDRAPVCLGVIAFFSPMTGVGSFGAALILAPWPYTMFIIMPTNKVLTCHAARAGHRCRRAAWSFSGDGCIGAAARSDCLRSSLICGRSIARSDDDILFERRGAAGIVTLNRPKALNAVTHAMVLALRAQLDRWADDPAVTRVVITAADGRAFSAGGDIRALYDLGKAGRHDEALQFWRDEYPLNAAIKNYRKPYIALIDGIAMGGGVGVSVHGSHRVAGDRFSFAMPEVGIGFFPDVGATWFLPRMPGELGTYCALTGERFGIGDGIAGEIATHRVPSARFPALLEGLTGTVSVDAVLSAFNEPASEQPIAARRAAIDRLFSGDMVENILAAIDREAISGSADAEWAQEGRRRNAFEIAAQSQAGAGAGAAREGMGFRNVHANGIPHSVACHSRA